jgi:hypothetical protein
MCSIQVANTAMGRKVTFSSGNVRIRNHYAVWSMLVEYLMGVISNHALRCFFETLDRHIGPHSCLISYSSFGILQLMSYI